MGILLFWEGNDSLGHVESSLHSTRGILLPLVLFLEDAFADAVDEQYIERMVVLQVLLHFRSVALVAM